MSKAEPPPLSAPAERGRRLRVAMFAMMPGHNAATRAFCERPSPYLREQGIDVRIFLPSGSRLYWWLNRPRRCLRLPLAALYWYGFVAPRRVVQLLRALSCDVVMIQRGLFRYKSPPIFEALLWFLAHRLLGRRIVYHCDDALYTATGRRYYDARFRMADVVITGNRAIGVYAGAVNAKVWLLDGAVDVGRYPVKRHQTNDHVAIGWAGTFPKEYLEPVIPALTRVCATKRAVVNVVAGITDQRWQPPELNGHLVWAYWELQREFTLFQEFDVGIMPLANTEYNRAKEAFKIKEYMAAGLPVVCSPVGHNLEVVQHGVTGYFASNEDEWVEYLTRLADDAELRARLGAAGRRVVEERYALPAQARKLAELLWAVHAGAALEPEAVVGVPLPVGTEHAGTEEPG